MSCDLLLNNNSADVGWGATALGGFPDLFALLLPLGEASGV
ncbi:MAG: hypothetical protein V7L29_21785 [Nostoc sp.]